MRPRLRRRELLAVAASVPIACTKHSTGAGSVRIGVGGQGQLFYLPARLAHELGHYAERGLRVTLHEFAGGAKTLEALLGGSVDVACGFYDHTVQMAAAGRNLVSFVLLSQRPCISLISRGARQVNELRRKIVGVTSPGSSSDLLLDSMLARAGIRREELSIIGIGTGASAVT